MEGKIEYDGRVKLVYVENTHKKEREPPELRRK